MALSLALTAAFAPAFAASCLAAQAPPDERASLRVKDVAINGAKVRLPLPAGFEAMRREYDPERHAWMLESATDLGKTPLALLIRSEDKNRLQRGEKTNPMVATAHANPLFNRIPVPGSAMDVIRDALLEYDAELYPAMNQAAREAAQPEFDYHYIHSGPKALSAFYVSRGKIRGRDHAIAYTVSYIVLDTKVVTVFFFLDLYAPEELPRLLDATADYLKGVERGDW